MDSKKPWLSKTIWTNVIVAGLAFVPSVHKFIVDSPELFTVGFTIVNVILRFVTKDKVQIV